MKYNPPVLKNENENFNSVTYMSLYGLNFPNVKEIRLPVHTSVIIT